MRIKQFLKKLFQKQRKQEDIVEELIFERKKKNQKIEQEVFEQSKKQEKKQESSNKESLPTPVSKSKEDKKQTNEVSNSNIVSKKEEQPFFETTKPIQKEKIAKTKPVSQEPQKKPNTPFKKVEQPFLKEKSIKPKPTIHSTAVTVQQTLEYQSQNTTHFIKELPRENHREEISFLKHLGNVITKDYQILQEIETEMDHIKLEIEQAREISSEEEQQKKLEQIKEKLDKLKERYEELEKDRTNQDLEILNLEELHYFKNKIDQIEVLEKEDFPKEETTRNMLFFIQELEQTHQELMKKNREKKLELAERKNRFESFLEEKQELEVLWKQGNQFLESQQDTLRDLEKKVGDVQEKAHLRLRFVPHGIRFLTDAFLFHETLQQTKRAKNTTAGMLMGSFFLLNMGKHLYRLFEVKADHTYEVLFHDYASVLENQKHALEQMTTYLHHNQTYMQELKQKIIFAYKQEKTKNLEYERLLKQIERFEEILTIQNEKLKQQEQQVLNQQNENEKGRQEAQQRKKILQEHNQLY